MAKYLIVNADDFGRSRGVNRGILRAHKEGIVTSTSLMVNQPFAQEGASILKDTPSLGAGVHLVFSAGKPILPPEKVPTLVDSGGFFFTQEVLFMKAGEISPDELKAEFKAQITRFYELVGREPDHLDCHHFIHVHPYFFAVYVEVAKEMGLPIRNPLPRDPQEIAIVLRTLPSALKDLPQEIALAVLETDQKLASSVPSPDRFIGSFFGEEAVTLENLLSILESVGEGVTELMCHPAFVDEELLSSSQYAFPREKELEVLCSPLVRRKIEELGIKLVTFSVFSGGK